MKKITIEEFILILIVLACVIAFLTRDLTINFSKDLFSNFWISSVEKQVSQNLENLENVTWNLYYSPVNSRNAFSKSLASADDTVKIQTYEFTKKEIKQIVKWLLEKWVIVNLIMENNKRSPGARRHIGTKPSAAVRRGRPRRTVRTECTPDRTGFFRTASDRSSPPPLPSAWA